MISPGFFFQNFDFSVKGQNVVQYEKRFCLLNSISQEPYIIWLSFVVDKCKMIISPGVCFHFFKILIFWFAGGINEQKRTQNDKNFCLLRLISQESLFIAHISKKEISYFFQFLIFVVNSGVKGQKMTQNDRKLCVAPISQEAYTIWCDFWYAYIKWWHLHMHFSFFQKFDFLGC